ncbi:MAG TPA: helix-turn-helix domain-containing protein [Streptosporangiaceae bacterium]|nr:helix-turn-helix domain-containing protein [Streptosporangiaceae bacterium]
MTGPRTTRPSPPCPIARAADIVGDRWTLLILRNANLGTTRFDDFRAELGIADNILSSRLARLVDAGLLTRHPYRETGRTRHEYRLTTAGADLLPVLHALADWGLRYTRPAEPADPMRVIHQACGEALAPGGTCPRCGRTPSRDEIAWLRPWRSPHPVTLASAITDAAPST